MYYINIQLRRVQLRRVFFCSASKVNFSTNTYRKYVIFSSFLRASSSVSICAINGDIYCSVALCHWHLLP